MKLSWHGNCVLFGTLMAASSSVLYTFCMKTLLRRCPWNVGHLSTGCKCTITTTSTLSHKLWLCVNISVFDHAFAATVLSFHKLAEVLCVYVCLSVCLYLDGYKDNYTTESSSWQTDRNPDDKWLDKPCLQETHSHAYTVPQFIFSFLLCCLSFLTDPDFFLSFTAISVRREQVCFSSIFIGSLHGLFAVLWDKGSDLKTETDVC